MTLTMLTVLIALAFGLAFIVAKTQQAPARVMIRPLVQRRNRRHL